MSDPFVTTYLAVTSPLDTHTLISDRHAQTTQVVGSADSFRSQQSFQPQHLSSSRLDLFILLKKMDGQAYYDGRDRRDDVSTVHSRSSPFPPSLALGFILARCFDSFGT